MTGDRIRVVLADDHARLRASIRRALEASDCQVCAEGASADEAVRLATDHRPDVALVDINMPGGGISATREITRTMPEVAVVMLTSSVESEDLFDALRAGASGYLLKDTDPQRLADALRGVLRGEGAMSPPMVARIIGEFRAPKAPRFARGSAVTSRLSPREWEVMELLAAGVSTDEVARRLFLSPTTVRVHVSTTLRKLRVRDRESAFRLLREG